MAFAVCAVAGLGIWDANNQSARAIHELMAAHQRLALALAMRVPSSASGTDEVSLRASDYERQLLSSAQNLETQGEVVVLVRLPNDREFKRASGKQVYAPELHAGLKQGLRGVTLSAQRAHELGLPRRIAVAGIALGAPRASENVDPPKSLAIAVLGSAAVERDRSARAEWRTILTVVFVSGLILGFGVVALRRQQQSLLLSQREAVYATERERDAELVRANRMATIAALSSGIVHEIATPLGVISGRIEQLQTALQGQERLERSLATIAAQVDRIHNVMRGFLALARGDAPTLVRTPAAKIVQEAVRLVHHRFSASDVALRTDARGSADAYVSCQPMLFDQVIVNLLINALEASPSGGLVELRVESDTAHVSFVVLDQGSGISPMAITRATEPFFTTKTTSGGTGLGLAIAREIVAHHGGELVIERRSETDTDAGRGTRVIVRLPIAGTEFDVT
jgi:signal transduction histidine kinase